jgi:hypothetical protein
VLMLDPFSRCPLVCVRSHTSYIGFQFFPCANRVCRSWAATPFAMTGGVEMEPEAPLVQSEVAPFASAAGLSGR